MMGMCVQKVVKISLFLALQVVFFGCEDMDNMLSSGGTYKINASVNNTTLDECSIVRANEEICPFFEESVSGDSDITDLVVFLKNSSGEVKGWKVVYSLKPVNTSSQSKNDNPQEGEEKIIPIENFDKELPSLPLPDDLPMGHYTIVYQIMSGKNILQRTEKNVFYLGGNIFSYDAINVYLPGVTDSAQYTPKDTVVMLEAGLDFNSSRFDPYIVWYEGKNKIREGKFSEGAGQLFWKAPEHSSFFSLSAEVFPTDNNFRNLIGYKKEISLLVSPKTTDVHLVSNNIEQLKHWYRFEGNLNDEKMPASAARTINPAAKNNAKWMGVNGTYGIATGANNVFLIPKVTILDSEPKTWQVLFRIKPLNDGEIFSVRFGPSQDIFLRLYKDGEKFDLTLTSPLKTVSQPVNLPQAYVESEQESFLSAGIKFSILPGLLSAQFNILGESVNDEIHAGLISLEANIEKEFQIFLGFTRTNNMSGEESKSTIGPEYNVLWDEFALYNMPPMDILAADIKPMINEEQQKIAALSEN